MKRILFLLLAASLAANVYLLVSTPGGTASTPSGHSAGQQANAAATSASAPTIPPEVWTLVQSGDPSSAERLRALGLPETIVRALIRAEVNARYRDREKALYGGDKTNYWERSFSSYLFRANDPAAALDLTREKEAELKRLLGPATPEEENPWGGESQLAYLPSDKREQIKLIDEDYRAMQTRNEQYSMIRLPEDREKQRFLEKQKRMDLEALLTPEELIQYDLRTSQTANNLRWGLAGFDMTEDEYKSLYALQKPFDEKYTYDGLQRSQEEMRARNDDQKTLDASIKETLGEQRYAEYKRAQDQDYKLLRQLNPRLEIPMEKINQAYDLKVAFEKKLNEFKPTPVPGVKTGDQRNEYRTALAKEAEAEFTKLLGEKAYAAVSDQILRRLRANSPATATTTTTTRIIGTP